MMKTVLLVVLMIALVLPNISHALKAEEVLGEYWKDPPFGEAAAEITVQLEILNGLLWPAEVDLPLNRTIRLVVTNKTDSLRLLAISKAPLVLIESQTFQAFVEDDILHATMEPLHNGQHTHAETDLENPQSLVKLARAEPTILVRPDEFKELLVRFDEVGQWFMFCGMSKECRDEFEIILNVTDVGGIDVD